MLVVSVMGHLQFKLVAGATDLDAARARGQASQQRDLFGVVSPVETHALALPLMLVAPQPKNRPASRSLSTTRRP
jgi:hypothetical protein